MHILDGRNSFYQWDLNIKVTSNELKVGDEVHFDNGTTEKALITEAYLLDGVVVANVPNIFLTKPFPIKIFRYIKDDISGLYTVTCYKFNVERRPQPEDYIYIETELLTVEDCVYKIIEEARENGEFGDKAVPQMTIFDEEYGHNRVYYIDSGTPVETTDTSVIIPQGKSIIVCALSDTNESEYSYLDKDGNPTAPPKPTAWEGALTTPTVIIEGTRASWRVIEGATKYRYIIGDCVPYMSWGGSFANTYNRLYTELTNGRGTYPRHALTTDVAPRDPDPEDFAAGKRLGSVPLRQDNGYILSPVIDANDEKALAKLAEKGYNLDLYLMPKSYTDSFARKCAERYFTDNSPVVLGKGENSVVQKGGTDTNKVTGKLAAAFGQNNEVSGLRGFAAGTNNNVSGTCAVAFGEGCVNTSWLGITVGRYLKALYSNQHWFGEFNSPVEKDVMGYRIIFGVGCGTSDSNRKNALIVYSDGRASVGREPKLDMDVVNKKYFDDKVGDIEKALDSIIAIQENLIGGNA
jgi:hypothetical protein